MSIFDHWALSGAIFVPILGAVLLGFLPRAQEAAQKTVALLTTLVTAGLFDVLGEQALVALPELWRDRRDWPRIQLHRPGGGARQMVSGSSRPHHRHCRRWIWSRCPHHRTRGDGAAQESLDGRDKILRSRFFAPPREQPGARGRQRVEGWKTIRCVVQVNRFIHDRRHPA